MNLRSNYESWAYGHEKQSNPQHLVTYTTKTGEVKQMIFTDIERAERAWARLDKAGMENVELKRDIPDDSLVWSGAGSHVAWSENSIDYRGWAYSGGIDERGVYLLITEDSIFFEGTKHKTYINDMQPIDFAWHDPALDKIPPILYG